MRYFLAVFFMLSLPAFSSGQLKFGLKAGLNFSNVVDAPSINNSNRTGYMIGGYIAPKPKKSFGFRTEFILSRQGYNYKTNTNTGIVDLDYLILPQLITLNFSKYVQLHAGEQVAYLLNSKVDSTGSGNGSLFNYFKRFDYGVAGGVEIYPLSGFFVGGRINVSLNSVNKTPPPGGNWPNFIPRLNARNNVVQLYAGWRF